MLRTRSAPQVSAPFAEASLHAAWAGVLALLFGLLGTAGQAEAQSARAVGTRAVGILAGANESRQLISRQDPSDGRLGLLAGVFVDVATPAGFDVLAEGYVVQRGGKVDVANDLQADVEADYLSMGIYAKGRVGMGPANIYLYGGPHVETHLRTRAAAELATAYREASAQTFGVTAGAGVEFAVGAGRAAYLEVRLDEGLTDAFPDPAEQIRHRTVSVLIRLARTPGG